MMPTDECMSALLKIGHEMQEKTGFRGERLNKESVTMPNKILDSYARILKLYLGDIPIATISVTLKDGTTSIVVAANLPITPDIEKRLKHMHCYVQTLFDTDCENNVLYEDYLHTFYLNIKNKAGEKLICGYPGTAITKNLILNLKKLEKTLKFVQQDSNPTQIFDEWIKAALKIIPRIRSSYSDFMKTCQNEEQPPTSKAERIRFYIVFVKAVDELVKSLKHLKRWYQDHAYYHLRTSLFKHMRNQETCKYMKLVVRTLKTVKTELYAVRKLYSDIREIIQKKTLLNCPMIIKSGSDNQHAALTLVDALFDIYPDERIVRPEHSDDNIRIGVSELLCPACAEVIWLMNNQNYDINIRGEVSKIDPNWSFPHVLCEFDYPEIISSFALRLQTGQFSRNAHLLEKPSLKTSEANYSISVKNVAPQVPAHERAVYIENTDIGKFKWMLDTLNKVEKKAIYEMLMQLIKLQAKYDKLHIIEENLTFVLRSKKYCLSAKADIPEFEKDGASWCNEN